MVTRTIQARLDDILDAIAGIRETLQEHDFAAFSKSWQMRRATERGIEIISEASRSIPPDVKGQFPHVPWSEIAGIGNILRHDYQNIQNDIIWNVVQVHLPVLEAAVTKLSDRFS